MVRGERDRLSSPVTSGKRLLFGGFLSGTADPMKAKQMIQAEIEYFLPWPRGRLSSCPAGLVISGTSPLLVGR